MAEKGSSKYHIFPVLCKAGTYPDAVKRQLFDMDEIVMLAKEGLDGARPVTRKMAEGFCINEDGLFEKAKEYAQENLSLRIIEMSEFFRKYKPFFGAGIRMEPMLHIVSNIRLRYGASVLLYDGALEAIGKLLGGGYYIIPSSVNEALVFRCEEKEEKEYETLAKNALTEINGDRKLLPEKDRLSDNLYKYGGGGLRIVR